MIAQCVVKNNALYCSTTTRKKETAIEAIANCLPVKRTKEPIVLTKLQDQSYESQFLHPQQQHAHVGYVKSLFTNIQKQYNILKISLPFININKPHG